jgi:hypothetical protein
MKRLLSRGALVWVLTGVAFYACGGDERKFVDTGGDDEGGAGDGASGGTAGNTNGGRGGASGTGTSGDAGAPPGGDGGTDTGGTAGRGGTSGAGPTGGTAGDGGAGGEGGEPEPPPPPGRPGTSLVAGGEWMQSTNYRLWVITGNGSLRAVSESTNYRLHGGIVGTTQP